jgi:hypothetical protein
MFPHSINIFASLWLKIYGIIMVTDILMDKTFRQITSFTIDNAEQVSITEVIDSENDLAQARSDIDDLRKKSKERIESIERNRKGEPQNIGR